MWLYPDAMSKIRFHYLHILHFYLPHPDSIDNISLLMSLSARRPDYLSARGLPDHHLHRVGQLPRAVHQEVVTHSLCKLCTSKLLWMHI